MMRDVVLLLAMLLAVAAGAVFAQYENFDQAQSAAEHALGVDDAATARGALTAAVGLAPVVSQRAWAQLQLALVAMQAEEPDPRAAREQLEAVRDLEGAPPVYRGLAFIHLARLDLADGDTDNGRDRLRRGLALTGQGSSIPVVRLQIVRLTLSPTDGDAGEAAAADILAEDEWPADVKALALLANGDILRCQGKLTPATHAYEQAATIADLAPAVTALVVSRRADIALEQQRWEPALKLYRDVMGMDEAPVERRAYAQLRVGDCLAGLDRREEAREAWLAAKSLAGATPAHIDAADARLNAPDKDALPEDGKPTRR